ncbi:hypothetical protein [Streptomyces sp. NPDC096323]|uniref:hypothetical protein n=1 Tax=Streptomyces sp. NPDC096323 TaxID=3155822 RepID=UPI00332CA82C
MSVPGCPGNNSRPVPDRGLHLTDNVSGYVAEAVTRQVRHQLLADGLRRQEEEHGPISDEELTEARAKIFDSAGSAKDTDPA